MKIYDDVLKITNKIGKQKEWTKFHPTYLQKEDIAREISDKFERFVKWLSKQFQKTFSDKDIRYLIQTDKGFLTINEAYSHWLTIEANK